MISKRQSVWCGVVAPVLLLAFGTAMAGDENRPALAVSPFDARTARNHQEAWAKYLGQPVVITNSIAMKLTLVPPGEFLMGSPRQEIEGLPRTHSSLKACWEAEQPQHRVRVNKPFYLGVHEVTQAEYERVVGSNRSKFKEDRAHPVEMVSWDEATAFCRKLGGMAQEQAAHAGYRLPTEAEWEYACRAGTTTTYYSGDDEAALKDCAWYIANVGGTTHPVAQKKPNAWGLYDMHGNVFEWCSDTYDEKYYVQFTGKVAVDPTGPSGGSARVIRGGCWGSGAVICRSASRRRAPPGYRDGYLGLRVAWSSVDESGR